MRHSDLCVVKSTNLRILRARYKERNLTILIRVAVMMAHITIIVLKVFSFMKISRLILHQNCRVCKHVN